jgi:prevent-host-death family protein
MAIPVITVGAFEARTHFSSLLKCVERGEEVLITRHGKAIARLIPVAAADRADLRATVGRMKELRAHRPRWALVERTPRRRQVVSFVLDYSVATS